MTTCFKSDSIEHRFHQTEPSANVDSTGTLPLLSPEPGEFDHNATPVADRQKARGQTQR